MARFWRLKSDEGVSFYLDPSEIVAVDFYLDDDKRHNFARLRGGGKVYMPESEWLKVSRWAESEAEPIPEMGPEALAWK